MILHGDRNQCPSCGKYFNSTFAFDKHRSGRIGVNRRCLTESEMILAGMMVANSGFWVSEAMPKAVSDAK